MSKGSRVRIGSVAVIAASVLAMVGVAWYMVKDLQKSKASIVASQRRYLKDQTFLENARSKAKEEARQEVAQHGKRATVEQRRKANSLVAKKIGRPKGPKAFFDAAKFARARANKTWKSVPLPNREFNEAEKEILEVADMAVSDRDLETAKDVAAAALKSNDARVRMRAVETLTEFGEAGLPELADFLSDTHPEVANLAADRFELGVQEVEVESEQVAIAKLGMLSIKDEDQLRSMAGTLIMASDALVVVQALADVIRNGSEVQRNAAKEAYQNQTGEEWQGEDAADKWLQENYTPPEPEETERSDQNE